MERFGKYFVLLSIVLVFLLGCQIVTYFGMKLGLGIVSFLFMGGIALSLVMSGQGNTDEELSLEDLLDDSSDVLMTGQGRNHKRDTF